MLMRRFLPYIGASGGGSPKLTYEQVVLADAPIAYWRLGEAAGPNAADSTGHGHVGTYTGALTFSQPGALANEPAAKAVSFAGPNNYVTVPDDPALAVGNGPVSVELWIKATNAESGNTFLCKGITSYAFVVSSDPPVGGFQQIWWCRADLTPVFMATSIGVTDGNWHHLVGTRDAAGTVHVYVDGVNRDGAPTAGVLADNATAFLIGSFTSLSGAFGGTLQEVALYNYELSAAKVLAHYNASL